MTPPCPRCGAPLVIQEDDIWCSRRYTTSASLPKDTCRYGHDAPRAMVPQPDAPVGVAPCVCLTTVQAERIAEIVATEYDRTGSHATDEEWDAPEIQAKLDALHELIEALEPDAQPAPAPQRTDAGGVMLSTETRDTIARAFGFMETNINRVDAVIGDGQVKARAGLAAARAELEHLWHPAPTPAANAKSAFAISVPGEYLTRDGKWVTLHGPGTGSHPWRVRFDSSSGIASIVNEWSVDNGGFYQDASRPGPNDIMAIYSHPATSAGVDEGMRERVAKAIHSTLTNPWTRAEDWLPQADAAIAAIPKLSPEVRETLLGLIRAAIDDAVSRGLSYDPAYLLARAELQAVP